MSKSNDQQTGLPAGFVALDEHGVMLINAQASNIGLHDAITEHLKQLHAMIAITYGENRVPLGTLPGDLQNDYLWAMARKVRLIQILLERLMAPTDHGQETGS